MFGIEFLPQAQESDVSMLCSMIEGSNSFLNKKVDFVLIPANPRQEASVDALLATYILRQKLPHINFVPTLSGIGYRGQSGKMRFSSQLISLKYAHFNMVALIGGEGKGMDSIEMISMTREVLGEEICIISGSPVLEDNIDKQRLIKKLAAGANRIITQPIFSALSARVFLDVFEHIKEVGKYKAEAFIGIFGIFHITTALRINRSNLGFNIPQSYIKSMGDSDKYAQGGVREYESQRRVLECYRQLWQEIQDVAMDYQASLYLSTPKHNDLKAYGKFS